VARRTRQVRAHPRPQPQLDGPTQAEQRAGGLIKWVVWYLRRQAGSVCGRDRCVHDADSDHPRRMTRADTPAVESQRHEDVSKPTKPGEQPCVAHGCFPEISPPARTDKAFSVDGSATARRVASFTITATGRSFSGNPFQGLEETAIRVRSSPIITILWRSIPGFLSVGGLADLPGGRGESGFVVNRHALCRHSRRN